MDEDRWRMDEQIEEKGEMDERETRNRRMRDAGGKEEPHLSSWREMASVPSGHSRGRTRSPPDQRGGRGEG
eukprot:9437332-Pyramimonas_sp.AAC.1